MSEPSNTDIIASTAASILSAREGYAGILEEIATSKEDGTVDEELLIFVHNTAKMIGLTLLTTLRVASNEKTPQSAEAHAALEKIRPLLDSLILLGEVSSVRDIEVIPYASQEEVNAIFEENKSFSDWLEDHGRELLDSARAS